MKPLKTLLIILQVFLAAIAVSFTGCEEFTTLPDEPTIWDLTIEPNPHATVGGEYYIGCYYSSPDGTPPECFHRRLSKEAAVSQAIGSTVNPNDDITITLLGTEGCVEACPVVTKHRATSAGVYGLEVWIEDEKGRETNHLHGRLVVE